MADIIKFTDEELTQLKSLQDEFNNSILQFGQLTVEELDLKRAAKRLEDARNKLESDNETLMQKQKELAVQLNAKYGPGELDPKTGIFTPAQKQAATA